LFGRPETEERPADKRRRDRLAGRFWRRTLTAKAHEGAR
jgi:hypothetical protein